MREQLQEFIGQARWFGGKGRPFEVTEIRELPLPGSTSVVIHLVGIAVRRRRHRSLPAAAGDVRRPAGSAPPRAGDAERQRLGLRRAARPGGHRLWLEAFAAGGTTDSLVFHRLPGHDLDTSTHSTLFSGEQSNSSVAFGEDAMMKVFRRVTPGVNPDIEVHRALTAPGATTSLISTAGSRPISTARSSSWRCCSSSCARRVTAGSSRWRACATCSPRRTCTPTRWAATSRASRTGSGSPSPPCTSCSEPPSAPAASPARGLADTMTARFEAALAVVPALAEHAGSIRGDLRRARGPR